MEVYVFKTAVKFKKQIKIIAYELNKINEIQNWNFDLEDCDKILRIESRKNISLLTCELLNKLGHHCEELI